MFWQVWVITANLIWWLRRGLRAQRLPNIPVVCCAAPGVNSVYQRLSDTRPTHHIVVLFAFISRKRNGTNGSEAIFSQMPSHSSYHFYYLFLLSLTQEAAAKFKHNFFSSLSFYSKPKLFLPHSAKWFWLFSLMNLKTSGLYCQLCIITKSQRSGAASRLFVPGDFILFDIDIVYTVRIGCT